MQKKKRYRFFQLLLIFFISNVFLHLLVIKKSAFAKYPLLIIRIDGKDYEKTVVGMREELQEVFSVVEFIIGKNTLRKDIVRKMSDVSPKIVVLMDNVAINLYKEYQKGLPDSSPVVPTVSLMASFIDLAIQDMKNAVGISYEVPVVTSVVDLRELLPLSINKVGIVHRKFMMSFVKENIEYCKKEHIDLVTYILPEQGEVKGKSLKAGLKYLESEKVDAIWVPNDNIIVNRELLRTVWTPFALKYRRPIIVGVEILVNPWFDFGTFAVVPDSIPLGMQAAEVTFDIMENNWQVKSKEIFPPRSVYKIINHDQATRLFKMTEDKLQYVDKIAK